MNYKKTGKILGLLLLCVLVGIFLYQHTQVNTKQKEVANNQGEEQQETVNFPKTYKKEVSNLLKFDLDVVVPEGFDSANLYKASATLTSLNQEESYQCFMGKSTNVNESKDKKGRDWTGEAENYSVYEDKAGNYLYLSQTNASYGKNPESAYIINSFYPDKSTDQYNADQFSTISDLSFLNREQAWRNVESVLEKMGLDTSTVQKKTAYSLDWETLKKGEQCLDVNGNEVESEKNPNWSKANEGYYYYIGQQYQDLPMYDSLQVMGNLEEGIDTSPLRIFQGEQGIVSLWLDHWFSMQEQEEHFQLVPFEQIMAAVQDKYEGTVKTNPLLVKQAKLYEYPVKEETGDYSLVPVWICSLEETLDDGEGGTYTHTIQMPISALTGEELSELEGH
ncbi:hypothetical protein FACS1894111_04810 [Clostridia bacterium]|nr:hypothetical protein FACS1894111_04810 [Clostridia bacterium]